MKHNGSFAEKNIRFLNGLKFSGDLPEGVEVLVPYKNPAVKEAVRAYYSSFYDDPAERIFMFGINPGRFGSGITGISFTDPIRLKAIAGIDHSFEMKGELSSEFIYAMIEAYGGLKEFASRFFLTAVCPLGFTLNGKNYNYYDDPDLESAVRPFVLKTMQQQIKIGASRKVVSTRLVQAAKACMSVPRQWSAPITTPSGLPPPEWSVKTSSWRKRSADAACSVNVGSRSLGFRRGCRRPSTPRTSCGPNRRRRGWRA